MSARNEVENYILNNWQDRVVAQWVIHHLPLLEKGFTHPPCAIFSLSFTQGLKQINTILSASDFLNTPKVVMSGGFEGTRGHISAAADMREVKALTLTEGYVTLMLEPDSYIVKYKKREPLLNIEQRSCLWATSGLVDAIILLPEEKTQERISVTNRYDEIHHIIQPAKWCANVDNPYYEEINMRGTEMISPVLTFTHRPNVHTSFLCSTKSLNTEKLSEALRKYSLELAQKSSSYELPKFLGLQEAANIIYRELVQELTSS